MTIAAVKIRTVLETLSSGKLAAAHLDVLPEAMNEVTVDLS